MSFFRRTTVEDLASNSEVRDKLAHYLQILLGNSQPNYNIIKKIQLTEEFHGSQSHNLREAWDSHEKLHEQFMSLQDSLKSKPVEQEDRQTCLDLKVLLARSLLEECGMCDFQCGANRTNGEKGRCLVGIESRVSSWF
ncbi:hypothetical protein GF325_03850, partial [Candidatus Bathyarchaeota archaeon]|nr:hypothetical protein [Candidatus Bathyarchaeota archaeon]